MVAKRERRRMERELVASLTWACEEAKPALPGFCWLTHTVDYQSFPESLVVTWVFDTHANMRSALGNEVRQTIDTLTARALADAGVAIGDISRHVDLDSEEACQRSHGGNWEARLHKRRATH